MAPGAGAPWRQKWKSSWNFESRWNFAEGQQLNAKLKKVGKRTLQLVLGAGANWRQILKMLYERWIGSKFCTRGHGYKWFREKWCVLIVIVPRRRRQMAPNEKSWFLTLFVHVVRIQPTKREQFVKSWGTRKCVSCVWFSLPPAKSEQYEK